MGNKLYSASAFEIESLAEVWTRNLPPTGTTTSRSSSPVVHRGRVYILRPEGAATDTLHIYELAANTGVVQRNLTLAATDPAAPNSFFPNGQDDLVAAGDSVRWVEWSGSITDALVLHYAPEFASTTWLRRVALA